MDFFRSKSWSSKSFCKYFLSQENAFFDVWKFVFFPLKFKWRFKILKNLNHQAFFILGIFFLGQWSSVPPTCRPVRCPALEILDPHLRVLALNNSFQVMGKKVQTVPGKKRKPISFLIFMYYSFPKSNVKSILGTCYIPLPIWLQTCWARILDLWIRG